MIQLTTLLQFFTQRFLWLLYRDFIRLYFYLLLFLSITLIPNTSFSSESELLPTIQVTSLKQLSPADGLSENTVNQIYEDNQGFIWLSTELGINRYDGHRIKNLIGSQSALPHKSITRISQDSANNFWISTKNGLSIFDENHNEILMSKFPSSDRQQKNANRIVGSFEILDSTDSNSSDSIQSNSTGTSWVITWNGLYRYSIKNKEISQPQSMKLFQRDKFNLLSYYKDKNKVWLGTSQGIYIFGLDNQRLTRVVTDSKVDNSPIHRLKSLTEDSVFFTTNDVFYQLDITDINKVEKLKPAQIDIPIKAISNNLITDFILSENPNKNEIIYSIEDTLFSFDLNNNQISKLFSLNAILRHTATYRIRTLFLDSQGLLWIGTHNRGAYIWDTKSRDFTVFNSRASDINNRLNSNEVWSIDQDANGSYWIGTNRGLNYIDAKSLKTSSPFDFTQPNVLEKQAKIYDLIQHNNNLWLATANDLSQLNIKTKKLNHFRPQWLKQDDKFIIFSLTSMTNDTLWLGTNIGTLKFDTHLNQFSYEKLVSIKNNKKMTRYITQLNGHIIAATETGVLVYSPKTGLTKSLLPSKHNEKGQLYSLTGLLYINNQLWLSFNGDGIYIIENNMLNALFSEHKLNEPAFNKNKIMHLNKISGFPDNSVYSLEMSHHFIWASTNTGLVRIQPEDVMHSIYDSSFGLPNNEFNEGASLLANGRLFYGTPNGLIIINPAVLASLNKKLQTPKITQLTLTHKGKIETLTFPSNTTPGITLSKNTLLSVQMSILDFRKTKSWEFEYWLDGTESVSKRKTQHAQISINNLNPGRYSLHIKAHSKYYLEESEVIQLELIVKDDLIFDKTINLIFFAIMMILFVLILTYLLHKNNKNKQKLLLLVEGEKRLENALLDKERGVWELIVSPNTSTKLVVFQESHSPMGLSLERYFDYIHKDDLDRIKTTWLDFLSGKTSTIAETYRVYFHGELIWNYIHGKITNYHSDGNPLKGSGIWVNVDKERKMEERLNSFCQAFESTLDIIFILDNNLTVVAVNQAYEISTGFICEQMIGRSMIDIAFSRFTSTETNDIKKKVVQNKRWKGKSSVSRRNASSFPVDIRINLITKDGHDTGYVVVMSDISESKAKSSEDFNNRFYDQVTGLPNKVLAFDRLREIIIQSHKNKKSFSLILLGVEHFTQLKKQLHSSSLADLFRLVSTRLSPYIDGDDVLARFDEAQFIIILNHKLGDEETITTINQLIAETLKPFQLNEINYHISVQAGISKFPDDSDNWSGLVTKAQIALEKTTRQISNLPKKIPFSYFQESRNKRAIERNEMERKLSQAIDRNELFLVFQPIVDIKNHIMIDAEVSFRWQMSKDKIFYPAQILLIASKIGVLTKITNWMIANTMTSLHRWNQEELHINLSFNLSSQYLLANHNLDFIAQSLVDNKINPADITVSINEECLSKNPTDLSTSINRLKNLGVALMLSEFAKDNAPLQKIQTFDFSAVRFDKALIRKIGNHRFSETLLESMISVVNQLGIKSIASGIENETQETFLVQHKCQLGQGYLYSDPLTENQMRQLMLDKQG